MISTDQLNSDAVIAHFSGADMENEEVTFLFFRISGESCVIVNITQGSFDYISINGDIFLQIPDYLAEKIRPCSDICVTLQGTQKAASSLTRTYAGFRFAMLTLMKLTLSIGWPFPYKRVV